MRINKMKVIYRRIKAVFLSTAKPGQIPGLGMFMGEVFICQNLSCDDYWQCPRSDSDDYFI
jgi:hypothetical protein